MAQFIFHGAATRGHADHGWLKAYHTFSFAGYHDPNRMHFGVLRVLNDDTVEGGMGFGTHPHDNMEIITIPLKGALAHKDSLGNSSVIQHGDIQVMSAGTGVKHSEFNADPVEDVNLLQIWVFPNKRDVQPRYDQVSLTIEDRQNNFQQILSPNAEDEGVWIHQDAWFSLGQFAEGYETPYKIKKQGNGVYAFVIKGNVIIDGHELSTRDGLGIWDTDAIHFKSVSAGAEILLMDIPMK